MNPKPVDQPAPIVVPVAPVRNTRLQREQLRARAELKASTLAFTQRLNVFETFLAVKGWR